MIANFRTGYPKHQLPFVIMFCQGAKFTKRESIEFPFLFCSQPHHFTEYANDAYSCDDHSCDQQTYDGQEGLPESPKSFLLSFILSGAPLVEPPAQRKTELLVTNDSLLPFWQQHQ